MPRAKSPVPPIPVDRLIAFRDVPSLDFIPLRRGGSKLNTATLYRWAIKGVKGIKLRAVRVGGQFATRQDWLHQFFEQLGDEKLGRLRPPPKNLPTRKSRRNFAPPAPCKSGNW